VTFWVEMAFWAEERPFLVEVRWFLCSSGISADRVLYRFGMEGSRGYDFCKPLPGVFPLQPSPSAAQQSQHLASSFSDFGAR